MTITGFGPFGSSLRTELFLRSAASFARMHWRWLTILALSLLLTSLYLYGRPYILYNDGDPLTYFLKGWWLFGHDGTDVPSRGPGYPLWLLLTGAASLNTWWGLALSQIAMAASAPVLVYAMVAPMSRNVAFATGMLFAVFGISYVHMNWVMTEEVFLFFELVALVLMSRYLAQERDRVPASPYRARLWREASSRFLGSPYPIVVLLVYATTVKPAASVFYWIFLFICIAFRVEPWRRYVGPTILYIALMSAWGIHDYYRSPVRFPNLAQPSSLAQRHFADVYYGDGYNAIEQQHATIQPNDGPASQRLYRAVSALVAQNRASGQWNVNDPSSAEQLYGRFPTDGALVAAIFERPNPMYFQLVTAAAASDGGDTLLQAVAKEHGNTGIRALARYFAKHPSIPLVGPPNPYVGFMFLMKYYRSGDFIATNQFGLRNLFLGASKEPMVREDNGPASKAFADSLRFFIDTFPQFIGIPDYLKDFKSSRDLADFAVSDPYFSPKYAGGMMGYLYQWLALLYGEETTGRLMGAAAMETTLKVHTAPGFLFGDFLAVAVLSGGGYYVTVPQLVENFPRAFSVIRANDGPLLDATVQSAHPTVLPAPLAAHVGNLRQRSMFSQNMSAMLEMFYGAFKWFKPFLFAGMAIFALPLIIFTRSGRFVMFLTIGYFVSAAAFSIVMIMPTGDPRHEDVFAFMPLVICVLGIASLPRFWRIARSGEESL